MKKLFALSFLLSLMLSVWAQKSSVVDSSDNVLSVNVLPAKDLKKIPVEISIVNPTPITCVQCYIAAPQNADVFCREEGANNFICSQSPRWTSSHQMVCAWNPKGHPSTLMTMVVSTQSENLKDSQGPIFTVYFDGSSLADGEYTVKVEGSNLIWTDKSAITTYLSPDCETKFQIKKRKVVKNK